MIRVYDTFGTANDTAVHALAGADGAVFSGTGTKPPKIVCIGKVHVSKPNE